MSSRRSKEKPFGLAKACKSAQLPSSTSTTKEGCNCDVVLSKTTKTSMSSTPVGRGEECSNKKSSNSGKCAGLVKATKTAKFPLVDEGPLVYEKEEPLSVEDKVYEVDSCLDHQLNEKSSLRRMLTEVATSSLQRTSPSSKREESKDENKSKKCSRLPPRGGGMVQKGCSRGGRVAASVVKGTRTAIIPFCEPPSVIVNTDNMDSPSSFCCSEDEDNGQQFSWQETAIRLPVPEEYNDDRSAYSSGKNQTFLSGGRCPSAVKFHTVEKFFAEGKEKGVRSCCISAALREQMLRSRKGGCSIVKESLAEKTQSSSEKLRLRSRSESPGKIPKGKNVEDVQAGTQRIYGLEVVGQIFQVLLDGKELWTAHNNTTNKKEKK